jgi:hypothetical protein
MRFCASLFLFALLAAMPAIGRAADARFSQTLSATESAAAGLNRLSSDQVAVIDALLRRELSGQAPRPREDAPAATRFSQRLSDDERRIAGFALLTEAELAQLDALVERHAARASARALLTSPVVAAPRKVLVRPAETKTAPEIHGSFFLSMGWGSGGYSEKTGGMTLNYEDPARGFAISVGYSETHTKGGNGLYIYRDPVSVPPPLLP